MTRSRRSTASHRTADKQSGRAPIESERTSPKVPSEDEERTKGQLFIETEEQLCCRAIELVTLELTAHGDAARTAPRNRLEQAYVDVFDTCSAVYRGGFDDWVTYDFPLRSEAIAQSFRLVGAAEAAQLVLRVAKIHTRAEIQRDMSDCPDDEDNERIDTWEGEQLEAVDTEFFGLTPNPIALMARFIRSIVTGQCDVTERLDALARVETNSRSRIGS